MPRVLLHEFGVAGRWALVKSFEEASRKVREFIHERGIGPRYWAGGEIYDAAGSMVGLVGYDGRVWPPQPWTPDVTALYVPK